MTLVKGGDHVVLFPVVQGGHEGTRNRPSSRRNRGGLQAPDLEEAMAGEGQEDMIIMLMMRGTESGI
jgi:hypothetical protein